MFIDSEVNTVGQRGRCRVLIPSHPFSVTGAQKMRLTLLSFEMRRQWFNVNQTNNEFYFVSANAYYPITIAPGLYSSFQGGTYAASTAGLDPNPRGLGQALHVAVEVAVAALNTALSTSITVTSVLYDGNARGFSITLGGTGIPADLQTACFQCKTGVQPTGVSDAGFFADTHEILGAIPTRKASSVQSALTKSGSTFSSVFPASLNSLEALYLRCNVQTSNFQTHGFERSMPDRNGMSESNIFARIPLSAACFEDVFEVVTFEDSNDLFQVHLTQKTLDSLVLEVTDDKGRLLSEKDPRQADLGLMAFKCTLRWDALEEEPVGGGMSRLPLVDLGPQNHPPAM